MSEQGETGEALALPEGRAEAWRRRTDPRLYGYLLAGFGALVATMATGRPELAALGAPFLALAALGLARSAPPRVSGAVRLDQTRVIEGDEVTGEIVLEWDGPAEVDVLLSGWRGITPLDPSPSIGWSLPPGTGPVTLPFRVAARSWGVHEMGALRVRVRSPKGLLVGEGIVGRGATIRVLPSSLRVDRLLKPVDPRAVAGPHLSRVRGHGTDFAELRPYRPGDRLKDVSWAASARSEEPWVTVHHPERTGIVLVMLDAFLRNDGESAEVLARLARTAWAVASAHLRSQDRVGLLAMGRTAAWLPPQGGRRARLMLLDELLAVGGAAEDLWRPRRPNRRVSVPADALIVGVTSLGSRMFTRDLIHHRRNGHGTVALIVDTEDLLPDVEDSVDEAALRVWRAQRQVGQFALERGGVRTMVVRGPEGLGPAVSLLHRRMSRTPVARVGATR